MQTNQIKLNNASIEKASERSIKYSKASKLFDLKKEFVAIESEHSMSPMCSFGIAPMRMAFASDAPAPGVKINSFEPNVDEYSIAKEEVSYAQSERLVQKALNRKK